MFRFGWAVISSVRSAIFVARDKAGEILRCGSSSNSPEVGGSSKTKVHRLQSTSQQYSSIASPEPVVLPEPKQLNDYVHEIFNPSGPPSIEIVFFHGLQLEGSEKVYINTWISRDGSQLWLKWIVDAYPKARILVISYDASVELTDHQGLTDMYITRENLVQCLTTGAGSVGQRGCPVILVGHGMGGLVLKEVCVQAHSIDSVHSTKTVQKLLQNIKGQFFYATPHHGSQLADTSTRVSKGLLFQDMTTLNPQASRRNQDFRELRRKFGWRAYGIGESFPITIQGFTGLVVEEASARNDVDSFYTASADHFNVCRPASTKCSSFDVLSNFVADILKEDQGRAGPQIELDDKIVGLDEPVKKLIGTLKSKARLAIVGMGGLGKTTLAKAVFNSISRNFDYTCFITDFKTKVQLNLHPLELRRQILQDMYNSGRQVDRSFWWSDLMRKKVLIVLHDVESESHVSVMTKSDSFANESRVIVTSRDKRFLIPENFECYFHELLNDQDSTRLFCLNAFKTANVPTGYEQHVKQLVKKSGGLPLALTVAGKYLYNREQGELWDDALKKLSKAWSLSGVRNQIDPLWSVLEFTYESLAESEQEMFLDIATCFHGEPLEGVQGGAWKVCSWASAYAGWNNLVDKGLVTTSLNFSARNQELRRRGYYYLYEQGIRMHELLRDWGRKKAGLSRVCYHFSNIPRTWPFNEAELGAKVLTIVYGIVDTESKPQLICGSGESKHFSLKVHRLSIGIQDLRGLDKQLKALSNVELRNCHWNSLPNSFCQLKDLINLEVEGCDSLHSLPESFGQLKALSHLVVKNCAKFKTLPESFGQLEALTDLEFVAFFSLRSLPASFGQLKALSRLVLKYCDGVQMLPESFGQLEGLGYLEFWQCLGLTSLPESFVQLKALSYLGFCYCRELHELPEDFGQLKALSHLDLLDCSKLQKLPESFGQLTSLNHLEIQGCGVLQSLPESFGQLTALNHLEIQRCGLLQSLPESSGNSLP